MLLVEKLISKPSFLAVLLVIRIAPFFPREPYKAEAAVPFSTLTLSIFSLEMSKKSVSTGTPSSTTNGALPRSLKLGAWKIPVGLATYRPATCPERAEPTFRLGVAFNTSLLICWVV